MANNDYDGNFYFRENIYPKMKEKLKETSRDIINHIVSYIDRNHDVLFNSGLYQLYWNTGDCKDTQILFDSLGYTSDEIADAIKETGVNNSSWKVYNKPHNWAFVCILKYFHDNEDDKSLNIVLLDLSFSMYATLFYKYFRFPPNKNIMTYTVNNLSNRYDLKKIGTLIGVLQKIAQGSHEKYREYLENKEFSDRHIVEYVMNLNTRINNFVKEIKREYEKNKSEGSYLNYQEDDYSEENYHENDNQSYNVERLTNKVVNKILTSTVNHSICEVSAKLTNVSVSEIKSSIDKIIDKENSEIHDFISCFLQQYLVVEKHPIETISSKNYLTYINQIYTKSNTKEETVIRMKELLDKWLNETSERYKQTERLATLNNYRKAIYFYFTLSVQSVLTNQY